MDIIGNIEDIERRLDSLIEKAEVWQKIFDEAPIAIAVFTGEMEFFLINNCFSELTGFTADELYGINISIVIPAKFKRMHKKEEKKFIANPEKKTNRHGLSPTICRKDRTEVPVYIDLSYFSNDNRVYYVAFLRQL